MAFIGLLDRFLLGALIVRLMYDDLMEDFRSFLQRYRQAWNESDADRMMSMYSHDVRIRWAYPGNRVMDEDFTYAARSWKEAAERYGGKGPSWSFEDVALAPISENEAFAAFWVTFEVGGEPGRTRAFFVEAFRREADGWKKIRSHVEYQLPTLSG